MLEGYRVLWIWEWRRIGVPLLSMELSGERDFSPPPFLASPQGKEPGNGERYV